MAEEKTKITKDMTLGELVARHPKAAMVLAQRGMHCIGCGMAGMETIEQGCKAHGLTDKDVDEIIKEMNEELAKE